ncbi:putative membrane protein YccC [Novosphingobium chloroacetimidivorans]|uniref:Putative membrane protein YccC n=1 Tax=Novosphingobium chloroacetimidivorans TaxID=1428314 RepID=A0A7W7KCC9_9SPHN|nr:FUSC family protein [Novosphingobium chloroacetimidivorans]MBB4860232.1 putative membrane protein YccC [Novosphingobium chloroacetimidivorans]
MPPLPPVAAESFLPLDLRALPRQLAAEARALVTPGPRMVDEWACIASVMLAIVLAHWIGARMVAWAAFTAFVLMKGDARETTLRGVLRIVGTGCGAALALALVPLAARSLPMAMASAALVGTVSLYGMLTARRAYAWLLVGLTFEMILLDKLEHPTLDTYAFAQTRLLEVVAGTIACVAVSLSVGLFTRGMASAAPIETPSRMYWHPAAARHAAQAGVTLALLPLLHDLAGIPELAQAGVTIMAVMIVPVTGLASGGLAPVSRRLLHRAIGCLSGSALALTVLLVADGSVPVLVAGTVAGILIGRHMENGSTRAPYIGLQFTLAILVVLVPDSYAAAEIRPGVQRLASILIGMALLEPVLLAWHAVGGRRIARDGSIGEVRGSE